MHACRRGAQRRYFKRLAVAMTFYLLTLFAAELLLDSGRVEGPLAYILASLPGIAILGAFWAMARLLIEENDEFLRLLLVRQMLFATALALSVATMWGFLELYDLVPHIEAYWVAILWFLGLGLGGLVNRLTLGAWGPAK